MTDSERCGGMPASTGMQENALLAVCNSIGHHIILHLTVPVHGPTLRCGSAGLPRVNRHVITVQPSNLMPRQHSVGKKVQNRP